MAFTVNETSSLSTTRAQYLFGEKKRKQREEPQHMKWTKILGRVVDISVYNAFESGLVKV
jgi:hypothetical protein